MNILALNAGSSSLKYRVFSINTLRPLSESETVLAGGEAERLGAETISDTVAKIIAALAAPTAGETPVIIDAVGHRIVQGGGIFFAPTLIDDAALAALDALSELAPLHNPSGVAGIRAARAALPAKVPQVAVFDTAFHHGLPAVAAHYALPAPLAERLSLCRYGFHGISYQYVTERLRLLLHGSDGGSAWNERRPNRLILCHLGSGASVCAVRSGQSVDTSMGFTPLEGLVMGTRSGDLDPGLLLHLMRKEHLSPDQLDDLLNHHSGLLGLSEGKSSDVRDLEAAALGGHAPSRFALECFAYRVRKYIGAYAAALGGVDGLAFSGGIGEHSAPMRARIAGGLAFLGLFLDPDRNRAATGKEPAVISGRTAQNIWVIPTDEERQIARETWGLLQE